MIQTIKGQYYYPKSSKSACSQLVISDSSVNLLVEGQSDQITHHDELQWRPNIAGVAIEVDFTDGGKFIATDRHQRLHQTHSRLETFEKNRPLILASVFLVPFLMWFILTVAMPKLAEESVVLIPQSVPNQMGEQSFQIIEELFLSPSELPAQRQEAVKAQWESALTQLSLPTAHFKLHVYDSEYFGPNAFALPNGTVVITDDLINKLDDNPDAILAVLLHEIGHVELKHSLRIVAQSISNTLAIAVIFGDVEGMGEAILGTGSSLVLNSFSRDMESEADDYALAKLVMLGKSPTAFSDAMKVFLDLKSAHEQGDLLKYLSSHPEIKERIKKAEEFGL